MFDINLAASWPPGSVMAFVSVSFSTMGMVLANNGEHIEVWWPHGRETFRSYNVSVLNPVVIRKVC